MKISKLTVVVENDEINISFDTQTNDNRMFVKPEKIDELCQELQKIKKISDPYNYEV